MGNMGSRWDLIKEKKCETCLKKLTKRRKKGSNRLERPSEYKKRKYCGSSCAVSGAWRYRAEVPFMPRQKRVPMPSRTRLNQAFSSLRSYNAMAERFGVSRQTIRNWMGKKKDLENPRY